METWEPAPGKHLLWSYYSSSILFKPDKNHEFEGDGKNNYFAFSALKSLQIMWAFLNMCEDMMHLSQQPLMNKYNYSF